MTVQEYIADKLMAFGVSSAILADLEVAGVDVTAEYGAANASEVGRALCGVIAELVFAPQRTSINEQGFSISWDTRNLGKYYWWLCKKYGVTPDADVLSALGISMVRDLTNRW